LEENKETKKILSAIPPLAGKRRINPSKAGRYGELKKTEKIQK